MLTYGYHYVDPLRLLDPKDNRGWLRYAQQREAYYSRHELPREFIYDYTSDYLPPQPALPPYVKEQNEAMAKFATVWNQHFSNQPARQITRRRCCSLHPSSSWTSSPKPHWISPPWQATGPLPGPITTNPVTGKRYSWGGPLTISCWPRNNYAALSLNQGFH